MKEMYIPCSTAQEKQEVIKHLVSLGYIDEDTDDHYLNLRTHEDDCIQSVVDNHCGKLEIVTPSQLLNKQEAPTMNKLKEAVQNSGLNKSELSRRLGKHHNYLNVILRDGCSTKKQNELIEMINQVKAGERFKSDDEIIADLSEKLEKSQQTSQHNADCAHNYLAQLKESDDKVKDLQQQTILDGIAIEDLKASKNELIRVANQKSEKVKNLSTRNTTLEKALTDERKNAQELTGEIEKEKYSVTRLGNELTELHATNANLEHELTKAGEELLRQDRVIEYRGEVIEQRNNECIRLEDEITLLNKENSELNRQRKSYMAAFFMLLSLVVICLLWSAFK